MKLILTSKDDRRKYLAVVTGDKARTQIGEVMYDTDKDKMIAHKMAQSPQMYDLLDDSYNALKRVIVSGNRILTNQERKFMDQAGMIINGV